MPTPESLISPAKSILGWGADNEDKYQLWRDLTESHMWTYQIHGVTKPGRDIFDAAVQAAISRKGLPYVGRQLLRSDVLNTRAVEAKELFWQLVSGCCKKIHETDKGRKIKQFTRNKEVDAHFEASLPVEEVHRITNDTRYTMRLALSSTTSLVDVLETGPPAVYSWSTVVKTQLVVLTTLSLIRLHEVVNGHYGTTCYQVRSIYGSLTKPPADGTYRREDIIHITSDQGLVDFVVTGWEDYSPMWLQVQLHKKDTRDATTHPDDRPYFGEDDFKPADALADYYNAPQNDCDVAA